MSATLSALSVVTPILFASVSIESPAPDCGTSTPASDNSRCSCFAENTFGASLNP